jgi:hypothetical protein
MNSDSDRLRAANNGAGRAVMVLISNRSFEKITLKSAGNGKTTTVMTGEWPVIEGVPTQDDRWTRMMINLTGPLAEAISVHGMADVQKRIAQLNPDQWCDDSPRWQADLDSVMDDTMPLCRNVGLRLSFLRDAATDLLIKLDTQSLRDRIRDIAESLDKVGELDCDFVRRATGIEFN